MSDKKYRVFTLAGKERVISADALADYCLRQAGGGYTVQQTANAMDIQRRAIQTGRLSATLHLEPYPAEVTP